MGGTAWDDVTGAALDPEGVRAARREDMAFLKRMKAYTRCPWSAVEEEGGKIIDVRWIDVNKGDLDDPNYRAHVPHHRKSLV